MSWNFSTSEFFSQPWEQQLIWILFCCHGGVCLYRLKCNPRVTAVEFHCNKMRFQNDSYSHISSTNSILRKSLFSKLFSAWGEVVPISVYRGKRHCDSKKGFRSIAVFTAEKKNPKYWNLDCRNMYFWYGFPLACSCSWDFQDTILIISQKFLTETRIRALEWFPADVLTQEACWAS